MIEINKEMIIYILLGILISSCGFLLYLYFGMKSDLVNLVQGFNADHQTLVQVVDYLNKQIIQEQQKK